MISIQVFVVLVMNIVVKDGRVEQARVVSKMKVAAMIFVVSAVRVFVALTTDRILIGTFTDQSKKTSL
jgi:hypothetical protein